MLTSFFWRLVPPVHQPSLLIMRQISCEYNTQTHTQTWMYASLAKKERREMEERGEGGKRRWRKEEREKKGDEERGEGKRKLTFLPRW